MNAKEALQATMTEAIVHMIETGELDPDLRIIRNAIAARIRDMIPSKRLLNVGDRVRLKDSTAAKYLQGCEGVVTEKKWYDYTKSEYVNEDPGPQWWDSTHQEYVNFNPILGSSSAGMRNGPHLEIELVSMVKKAPKNARWQVGGAFPQWWAFEIVSNEEAQAELETKLAAIKERYKVT